MRWDGTKWVVLTQTKEEIDELMEQMRDDAVIESKEYSEAEIKATRQAIINQLNEELNDVNTNMTTIEKDIDGVRGRVSSAEKTIDKNTNQITSAQSKISSLEVTADDITTQVSDIKSDVTTAQKDITRVEQTAGKIESTVSSVKTDLESTDKGMKANETRIKQLPDEIDLAVKEGIGDLDIGARNYALESDEVVEYQSSARYSYELSESISEYPLTKFSVSFDMKYTGTGEISRVEIYLYNGSFLSYAGGNDSGNRENTPIGGLKNNGNWARYKGTLYTVDDIDEHDNITII